MNFKNIHTKEKKNTKIRGKKGNSFLGKINHCVYGLKEAETEIKNQSQAKKEIGFCYFHW